MPTLPAQQLPKTPTSQTSKPSLTLLNPMAGDNIQRGSILDLRARGKGRLLWFINGQFIGSSQSTELAEQRLNWKLRPGQHQLLVVDQQGRSQAIDFTVSL